MSYPSYGPEGAHYRPPDDPAPVYPRAVPAPVSPPASPPPASMFPASMSPASVPTTPMPPLVMPPVSGPPTVAYAQQPPPGETQPPAGVVVGRTTLLIAALCLLALVAGGAGFGLYLNERGDLRDTRAQLREQQDLVVARDTTIAQKEKANTDLTTDLTTTEDSLSDVTKERDLLVPCMRRVQELFNALRTEDDKKLGVAIDQADAACKKAEAGIDS